MKFSIKKSLIVTLVFICTSLFSQVEKDKDSVLLTDRYIIFEGDTLLIELNEVQLLKKLKFKTSYDRRYYYWFRKKTLKAYPYAKLAADRLNVLNERLEKIKSKRRKKKYTKRIQKYLEENNLEFETIKYLENPLTITDIKDILTMLDIPARKLMRTKEDIYKELNLSTVNDEDLLIEAMVKNPRLIERPIVVKGNKAVIGRPIENVIELLNL